MQPLHELHLMLSARFLQAKIEFHSRIKGELSAFAEQVLLYFLVVRMFVNCLFFNCHVMLHDAVYGDFCHRLRALSYVPFTIRRCHPFSPISFVYFHLCSAGARAQVAVRGIEHDCPRTFLTRTHVTLYYRDHNRTTRFFISQPIALSLGAHHRRRCCGCAILGVCCFTCC
jgi:hypothetical protein